MKRESKLSRKADKTGQDSLVMLNRELQQVGYKSVDTPLDLQTDNYLRLLMVFFAAHNKAKF